MQSYAVYTVLYTICIYTVYTVYINILTHLMFTTNVIAFIIS